VRVLMLLSTSSVTGPAELCLTDASALRDAGHEVLFGFDTRRPGNYEKAIREAGFAAMDELALCRKSAPLDVARDVVRLRQRMKGADLVHCRFSHDHAVALTALQGLAERPALVRSVEVADSLRPGLVRSASLRACEAVILPCEPYSLRVRDLCHVPARRLHVLPGRVDAARFCPGDGANVRGELGVKAGELLFGMVSRIKAERLHEVVLRALARIPLARLAVVGRGEHEPAIRALAAELHLADRVIFAGYRQGDALVSAYRALDVKIWLAEGNDGTCRAVLEAMACGKPVIVGDQGALPEIVREGVDGRVVLPRDDSVAQAMRALGDEKARAAMGKAALERARTFTPERRGRLLLEVYRAALEERAA
jgi:L-malate glycosyltransferase